MSPSEARANEVERTLATDDCFWFRSPATFCGRRLPLDPMS